jgi:hypothetical protein
MRQRLQVLADDVVDGRLHFLDAGDVVGMNDQGEVCQLSPYNFAAVVTHQREGGQATFARLLEGRDDVARTAAGGDSYRNVFGPRLGDELAQEDNLNSHIVGNARQVGRLERKGNRGDGLIAGGRQDVLQPKAIDGVGAAGYPARPGLAVLQFRRSAKIKGRRS